MPVLPMGTGPLPSFSRTMPVNINSTDIRISAAMVTTKANPERRGQATDIRRPR